MVIPGNQGGGSTTLELPATAPSRQLQPNIPPPEPPTQELVIPKRQLRDEPGYQQVTVTVTEPNGSYVTDLQKQDFTLYMDGQQRPIEFFRQDLNTPVSVGILVDTSGSMEPKLRQARAAIVEFLRNLNDKDDVFLFAFSGRPFMLQDFTTDHSLVADRLALLHAYGSTSLYDAVVTGLVRLQRGRYDKRALLVVTDGMDNTSAHSLADVAALARRQGVLIYSIGIGNPNVGGGGPSIRFGPLVLGGRDEAEEVDVETLRMLSTETGAKTYNIRAVGDGTAWPARVAKSAASCASSTRLDSSRPTLAPAATGVCASTSPRIREWMCGCARASMSARAPPPARHTLEHPTRVVLFPIPSPQGEGGATAPGEVLGATYGSGS